jgi:hypothetical protein
MCNEPTDEHPEETPSPHGASHPHHGLRIHVQAKHDLIDALHNAVPDVDDPEFVHVNLAPKAVEKLTVVLADLTATCFKRGQTNC